MLYHLKGNDGVKGVLFEFQVPDIGKDVLTGRRNVTKLRSECDPELFRTEIYNVDGYRFQLPNGVSVTFSGTVDAGALTTVLNTAATLG